MAVVFWRYFYTCILTWLFCSIIVQNNIKTSKTLRAVISVHE